MAIGRSQISIINGIDKVQVADLLTESVNAFLVSIPHKDREQFAARTGAISISKFRFEGEITSSNGGDWLLSGRLGATVVQQCVVSLVEMKTRIDVAVARTFVQEPKRYEPGPDRKIPEDDTLELLAPEIDLYAIARETLVLELPAYPRISGAKVDDIESFNSHWNGSAFDERPFSALSSLL